MLKTRLTEILGIEYPIIQGGLAYIARAELAAAVSNAGGLGQITAGTLGTPEDFRQEIRKARSLTNKPFSANLVISAADTLPIDGFVDVAIEEGLKIASLTAGNPAPYLRKLKDAGFKVMVDVGSIVHAQKAESLGADSVTAIGYEAGGHLGLTDVTTMILVARIAESVSVPVIAAGGIADGRGLLAALAMGADGIMMGTRFVATQESGAHPTYKEALVRATENDTVVVEKSIRRSARALNDGAAARVQEMESQGTPEEEIVHWEGKRNRLAAIEGRSDEGLRWAGQSVGLVRDIPTVAQVIRQIIDEALAVEERLHSRFQSLHASRATDRF